MKPATDPPVAPGQRPAPTFKEQIIATAKVLAIIGFVLLAVWVLDLMVVQ